MTIRLTVLAMSVSALTFLAAPAFAQNDHVFEGGVNLWTPTPHVVLSTEGLTEFDIESVDFVDVFGLEKKRFPEFHATLGRSHKLRVSYAQPKYEADTRLTQTIVFRGRTFAVDVPATADITWDIWKAGYEWDFVHMDRGYFGVVAELKYNRMQASIDSPALTAAAATDTKAWVPTLGVAGRGYVHPTLSIGGEFTGFKLTRDDLEAEWWDFDINGGVHIGRHFAVMGGYKSIVANYDIEDDRGDIKLKGPYFGVNVKF